MIYEISYIYDNPIRSFYIESKVGFEKLESIINKWNLYTYGIDRNFCFGAEDMTLILNTYYFIEIMNPENINIYDTVGIELFGYEDNIISDDNIIFSKKDELRKIVINKMIKNFYDIR